MGRGVVKFSKILRRVAHKGGGGLADLEFFLGGGGKVKRGEVNISGWD